MALIPPPDLLARVEGIERGLRQRKRLGAVWWVGVVVAGVQFAVLAGKFGLGLPALVALGALIAFLMLAIRTRFWLEESRSPFRYTCSIGDFELVTAGEADFAWLPGWLRHDLYEKLSGRVGRLSFLDESHVRDDATDRPSHIHVSGSYLLREHGPGDWIVEVAPRIRIGAAGAAETFAHPVKFQIGQAARASEADRGAAVGDARDRTDRPPALGEDEYEKIFERVYFSVASEVYRQIRSDVESKIALLPTSYLRATAYFYEALDYERSNTLDAYDEARKLYEEARKLYRSEPAPRAEAGWRLRRQRLQGALRRRTLRAAARWPGLAKREVMASRADVGYANMLLYRRVLARLSGRRLNPIFEARPVAADAVERLRRLPQELEDVKETLFDAHVTLALAWHYLGSDEQADGELIEARRLLPARAEQNVRYLFAAGLLEPRRRSAIPLLRRATELDHRFEVAQFEIASQSELIWRTRPTLEASSAQIVFDEYEEVLRVNPGNVGAWAALGYMHWLLGRPAQSRAAYQRGREYKEIKRETFVAELDYGLARIAAEEGDFDGAYAHYLSGVSASMAQGVSHDRSALYEHFFELIGEPMLDRFRRFRANVEAHLERLAEPERPLPSERVARSVHAFVLNGYGEACFNHYVRTGDKRRLTEAADAYLEARDLNPAYVLPHYDLYLLETENRRYDAAAEHIDRVVGLEPGWADGMLARVTIYARAMGLAKPEADRQARIEREATERARALRSRADRLQRSLSSSWTTFRTEIDTTETAASVSTDSFELAKEAGYLEGRASRAGDEARRLADQVAQAGPSSSGELMTPIETLLPHSWLWKERDGAREFDWSVIEREDLRRERRFERELDDLHVRALRTWAVAGLAFASEDGRARLARLLLFLRRHFWAEDFGTLFACRDLPGHEGVYDMIDRRLERWFAEDPSSYAASRWSMGLGDHLRPEGLASSSSAAQSGRGERAFRSYWRAAGKGDPEAGTGAPDLLFRLGRRLEELERWEESLAAYRRALERLGAVEAGVGPHEDGELYRPPIGRVLWELGRQEEAVREWERVGGQSAPGEWWRTSLVLAIRDRLETRAAYRLLWAWLAREQRRCLERADIVAGRDVARALGSLSVGYEGVRREEAAPSSAVAGAPEALPAAAPIAIQADARLFPQRAQSEDFLRLIGRDLPEMEARIRERTGVKLPGVRIRALPDADPGAYALLLHEVVLARGRVALGKRYCPHAERCRELGLDGELPGAPGSGGMWLAESAWSSVERAGLSLWDPYEYLVFQLESVVASDLASFLGVNEVREMLREWAAAEEGDQLLVETALASDPGGVRLAQVLQELLRENVPVRRLKPILVAFGASQSDSVEVREVVEAVRRSLIPELPGNEPGRRLVGLGPALESEIARHVRELDGARFLAIPAEEADRWFSALRSGLDGRPAEAQAIVVRKLGLRPFVRRLTELDFPDLPVLSEQELAAPFAPIGELLEYAS